MNTQYKYRPQSIDEFVFTTDKLERQIRRYTDGKTTLPLVLHGTYGTGKSLLAELIPKAIDGEEVSVNKINAEDLNNKKEVRAKFSRAAHFDRLFSVGGQTMGYTVVEEVNFDPTAKGALRTCLDDMAGRELFIFTTNEVERLDRGLLSRSEVVEVLPVPPDRFISRAKHILAKEGVVISEALLRDALDAIYEADCDNRSYYKALDDLIDDWQSDATQRKAA